MDRDDAQYLAEIIRVLQETDVWVGRISAASQQLGPAQRSPLRGDDDRAHPYELSHATWHSLSNAVDHLGCLRVLLGDAKVIHLYAPFTLMRAALENACAAVWLLEPSSRPERLARRLRVALGDIRNSEQVKTITRQPGARPESERVAQVQAIARAAGLDETAVRRAPSYSEIVRAVDEAGPANSMFEVSWKLCSGYAHGDWWTTLSSSRRTEVTGLAQPGVGTFQIEADLALLTKVTTAAVGITRWGWMLYDQRCQAPY